MKKTSVYFSAKWKSKRLQIFKRDKFTCNKCGSNKNLQCHHNYYLSGRLIHEYPNQSLSTLCDECHSEFHKKTKGNELLIDKKELIDFKIQSELKIGFDIFEVIKTRDSKQKTKILKEKPKKIKKLSKHKRMKRKENKFLNRFSK